jgi:hypothetical protein
MGHSRIGTLPRTRDWDAVVDYIATGAKVATVAEKTLVAAQKALGTTKGDAGFREAVYLLAQIGLAGGAKDAAAYLEAQGVELKDGYSAADLVTALYAAVDERMEGRGQRHDWGELARGALVTAVSATLKADGEGLFDASRETLTAELRPLHREKGFGELGRTFFASLASKTLNYFLSKTLGTHVGAGRQFPTMKEFSEFKKAMGQHCNEAAVIVEKFSGQWLQKRIRKDGGVVTRETAERFGAHAIKKMQLELAARAGRHGK